MSFGFGISDFVCCGQLAYQLYTEFKDAPGDCQALAKELLLFHQVILKTQALVRRRGDVLDEAEQATLGLCLEMCEDILFVQIVGADSARGCLCTGQGGRLVQGRDGHLKLHFVTTPMKDHDHTRSPNFSPNYKYLLRQKFGERTFAKRIPKIRSAISTVIEKLTSFQVLTIR